MMKKILLMFVLCIIVISIHAQHDFFYNHGEQVYYEEDKRSAIIIVSGDSTAVMRVGNRLKSLSYSIPLDVYFTCDDDVVFLYGDSLSGINTDSIIRYASGNGIDSIIFFSYAKNINGKPLWFRNEILVELKENISLQDIMSIIQTYNLTIELDTLNEYVLHSENEDDLVRASNSLYESGLVIYSAPDYYSDLVFHSIPPTDPKYPYQYYLNNSGQIVPNKVSNTEHGEEGVDIKAVNAWKFVTQVRNDMGNSIKVAVIDDGVEVHEDLMSGSSSRVLQGWTCGGGNGSPTENSYHGQLIAGIIAASHNDIGVAGVAPNTEIVPIRIQKNREHPHYGWSGYEGNNNYYSNGKIARAIRKAWKKYGSEILNICWSGYYLHDKIERALSKAKQKGRDNKGCIIIASVGNESYTNDINWIGKLPYVISVGAIDKRGQHQGYSNYNSNAIKGVNVVAFGGRSDTINDNVYCDIRSTDRTGSFGITSQNYYDYFGMTSAAAPMVSGVASLMLSVNPNLTSIQVKNIIEQTAQKLYSFQFEPVSSTHPNGTWNEKIGYGLVDAHKAVVYAYMYGHDEITLSVGNPIVCNSFICSCNIYHPELFTYEWTCSSNLSIMEQNGTQATIIPLSSGYGTITIKVLSYGRVMYTKSITVDLTTAFSTLLQPVSSTPITITNSTQWSNDNLLLHTLLTIDSLATLTISGTLYSTPSARLIVRPGGKLIVDGGTLTSACPDEMWQGIEVVGDRTKRQLSQYQGTVELRNGAVVENAICGIYTGLRGDTSYVTTGGIIKADSAFFVNNQRAVTINSYTNTLPNGSPTSNVSHFYKCTFVVDNNNLFAANNCSFQDHVTLWDVWNIKFKGCSFSNLTNEQNDRRHAIYAEDAGITLDTYCNTDQSIPEGCECPDTNSTYNEFSGFSTAVEVNTSGGQHSVEINSARFTNNEVGICINGNHYATITRNRFDMTAPTFRYVSGLVLNNCTGYKVEGNSYKGVVNYVNGITTGILVNNNNSSQNIIYRDTFNTLTYGLEFLSNNRGVQAQCNTFDGDGTDIYVCRMSTMSSSQGSLQISAGNMFNHIYGFNIQNKGFSNIDYYYSGTPASNNIYYPTIYSSNVTLLSSNLANPCTPTLCNNNNNNPRLAGFSGMMDSYTAALDSIGANDDSPLQGENLPLTDMARNLSEIYYAAVRSILSDTVLDLNALEQWHSAAQPIADPYSLTETRFAMGYSEPFVADADDAELANYAEFHAMKLALRNNDSSVGNINWHALTDAQIAQLQTIAERNTGRASEMAKGVLCFFFGICYDNDLMVDDNADNHDNHSDAETRSAKAAQQDGETNLNVYPNPTDDILYVELSGAGIANATLYDLQGRVVGANNDSPLQGTATLNVRNVPAGVYVLRVTDVNGKEYHRKVVVD